MQNILNEVSCPCCDRVWPIGCEQAVSIDLYSECVVCKFTPLGKGSSDGTKAELAAITNKTKTGESNHG